MTSLVGQPISRVDGVAKVTGRATYAAEFQLPDLAYGAIVQSTIPRGRITEIDTSRAERARGVLAVLTYENAPQLPYSRPKQVPVDPKVGGQLTMLQDDLIRHSGQHIGVVVAETFEQATHAADLVEVAYDSHPASVSVEAALPHAVNAIIESNFGSGVPAAYRRGHPPRALAAAPVKIDQTYTIARENHNPIEMHATVAAWDGDRLTLYDKTQWPQNVRSYVATTFGMEEEKIRVISPFVGGAFGSGLRVWPHVVLAAMAARQVGRPVKIVLNRRQMYTSVGARPYTIQRVALGAGRDGKLTATIHEAIAETSTYEEYTEQVLDATWMLYACDNVETLYRLARLDINTPTPMRGPGHVSGLYALESAMDELAVALEIDPIELRLRNHAEEDAHEGLPYSSKSLRACYEAGAERFGWDRRNPQPRSMRVDGQLVGYGMAGVTYPARRAPASASARILRDGTAVVRSATSDIGPGTYTSMTQVAAEALGLPVERVRFELGDSDMPMAPVHGGSMTMASVGPAVHEACIHARRQLLGLVRGDGNSPLQKADEDAVGFADGRIFLNGDPSAGESFAEILERHRLDGVEATAKAAPGDETSNFAMHSFGAVFAEVRVDPDFGTVRVKRLVGAYGIGRVINPKIARSQCIGGMVGGIGMALLEETRLDPRLGRVTNANLAEYLVPVHADIEHLDVIFVEEDDPHINPLGAKGVAEIAICGVAPAIANAVYHATGRRIRDLPITPERLLL
jgi:xanthine dehydrogenase YagR molybdenum-binding subunit